MLILRILRSGPRHGYGIAKRIQLLSMEVLSVGQGSLYPALHRLEERGWIQSQWGRSETNRQVKFYELTDEGKKQTSQETSNWKQFSKAIELILENA